MLETFSFEPLFIEQLGWDRHGGTIFVTVDGTNWTLNGVAQKRGVQVLECRAPGGDAVPEYNIRKKIEKQVTKQAFEHLIIFTDAARTVQVWQWVSRTPGRPDAYRETTFHPASQTGELLLQKLQSIRFTLDEEEGMDIAGTLVRLRDAFDRDKVTKKFYNRFKEEQQAFLAFIEGIGDPAICKWYASLMLNRLMFVWFIQEKGFLDGNKTYLRDRLAKVRAAKGDDRFHAFYRYFLLALFHEGFGKRDKDRKLDRTLTDLIGRVPYLNGGLFDPHSIEIANTEIHIPDQAFERLFAFFDEFDWHLDTRTIDQGNEINPDVLGYIFEKYINQKQMGAYYTKEDITEYISKNTILPYIFDAARKKCAVAFQPASALWRMLSDDPDAFIYPAVRKGVIDADGNVIPLPPEIEVGVDTAKPNLLERRKGWNVPATAPYALPTETWREHVARRQRCLEIRERLRSGAGVSPAKSAAGTAAPPISINDLITYNLDIRQFAQRAIAESEGPELLRAIWQALRALTVLDPTCGSGAFLFAALEILFPLYDACLTRMQGFVEDLERSNKQHSPQKFSDFRSVLADISRHPSRDYFILKSIIVNNLYGVDIMPEAVEICKLRLFLKLVAQVGTVDQIEPLPDIDFNIRAGNTLVGFTSLEEIRTALSGDLVKQMELPEIEEQAEIAARAHARFLEMQTKQGMDAAEFTEAKQDLRDRLATLGDRLNAYLAEHEYSINPQKPKKYEAWVKSHQPFHWFVEFYGIMNRGGFDVIIGNPPYVEYSQVKQHYYLKGYKTEPSGNLYAFVIERCYKSMKDKARCGMIVQLPMVCTDRMITLQTETLSNNNPVWFATFDDRPARLFDGLEHIRATIFITHKCKDDNGKVYSTRYNRWYSESRNVLFPIISFIELSKYIFQGAIPKIGDNLAKHVLGLISNQDSLARDLSGSSAVYFHNAPQYWVRAMDFAPYFWNERNGEQLSTQVKTLRLPSKLDAAVTVAALNSSLFYWWFLILSDCRHLNMREIETFPLGHNKMPDALKSTLADLTHKLMDDFKLHKNRKKCQYKTTGKVVYDEYFPKHSKPIIDEIDKVLAQHYGFTDEELDFIINYDIKYRMGGANAEG